jgi:hypothetical protein
MSEDDSNFQETNQTVRGIRGKATAESLLALTQRSIDKMRDPEDYRVRLEEQPDGRFDMVVMKRVN